MAGFFFLVSNRAGNINHGRRLSTVLVRILSAGAGSQARWDYKAIQDQVAPKGVAYNTRLCVKPIYAYVKLCHWLERLFLFSSFLNVWLPKCADYCSYSTRPFIIQRLSLFIQIDGQRVRAFKAAAFPQPNATINLPLSIKSVGHIMQITVVLPLLIYWKILVTRNSGAICDCHVPESERHI